VNLKPIRVDDEPEINLISMIDVLLVLVLFLVLTTTFAREAQLNVELPQAALQPTPMQQSPLEVVVDGKGRWYVAQREVLGGDTAALSRALEQIAGAARSQPLTIRADGRAPHQSVVSVLEVAGRLGFNNVAILTVEPPRSPQR
jgi:biopolymer transport protein ExbD